MRRVQETSSRLNINGTHQVLAKADGVSLIGDDIRTIERNADVLLNACKDIGLAVNIGKTKYMEIGCHRGMIAMRISGQVVIPMKMWKRLNTQALY